MQFLVIRTPRLPAHSQISNGAAHRTGRRSTYHTENGTKVRCRYRALIVFYGMTWHIPASLRILFPRFLGFRTFRSGLKPPVKKLLPVPSTKKQKSWNSVSTFGSALYKFQRIWSEKKEFDTHGLITCTGTGSVGTYRYAVCFKKSLPAFPWCTLKICYLFSWPGLKGRILILNDLKSRIRIKSFRIHALPLTENCLECLPLYWRVAGSVTSSTVSLSSPEEPGSFFYVRKSAISGAHSRYRQSANCLGVPVHKLKTASFYKILHSSVSKQFLKSSL